MNLLQNALDANALAPEGLFRRYTCSRFTRMLKWLRQNRLPFRRGSRPEKLWLIYNTSPPLQVDGRFMVGGFCVEDVPGIHSPPAAVCQELDLFRMIIIPQNPVDYTCQLFPVNRFEQVVKRPGVKAVENIVPISGYKDNGAVRTCAAREMPFSFSSSMSSRRR